MVSMGTVKLILEHGGVDTCTGSIIKCHSDALLFDFHLLLICNMRYLSFQ